MRDSAFKRIAGRMSVGTEVRLYVAGPPGMVSGVQIMLNSAGVTNDDIRTEKFAGY
jgi:hypothetical protein